MSNEIKENNFSEMLFNRDERLLDYITNLQDQVNALVNVKDKLLEENERLKKLEYKFFYCSEDEESFTLEDYLELGNKVYDLEQEISRLNNIINKLEKWLSEFETKEFNYNFLVVRVKDIQDKLKELKEEGK